MPVRQPKTKKKTAAPVANRLSRAKVLDHLAAHPDFFLTESKRSREVVKNLLFPDDDHSNHHSNVVSLTDYQNKMLRREAEQRRDQTERDRMTASRNYQLMLKMHRGCLALLAAGDTQKLALVLDHLLREDLGTEHYSFILFKRVPKSPLYLQKRPAAMMREVTDILREKSPVYGRDMSELLQDALGGSKVSPVSSYLCLPLHSARACLGLLCFFSADADRFGGDDKETHLVEFFQSVLAFSLGLCLRASRKTSSNVSAGASLGASPDASPEASLDKDPSKKPAAK